MVQYFTTRPLGILTHLAIPHHLQRYCQNTKTSRFKVQIPSHAKILYINWNDNVLYHISVSTYGVGEKLEGKKGSRWKRENIIAYLILDFASGMIQF